MSAKRKIAVFTGTRAEYGLLRGLLLELKDRPACDLALIAGAAHFEERFGRTVREIEADGLPIAARVTLPLSDDSRAGNCASFGAAVSGLGRELEALRPDILVLLGDRYESMAAAVAASLLRVPLAHIHGGETTEGAVDEAFRHSITKMSHLHFTACEEYRLRVIQLGEAPERVWNAGSLGVENIHTLNLPPEEEMRSLFGFSPSLPYIICTFHPVTLEADTAVQQCSALLRALEAFPEYGVVFTGANADSGGMAVNALLQEYAARNAGRFRFIHSLGVLRYLAAVKYSACVAGNSSSGIIEAPSLGAPALDIGDRQKGRARAASVRHAEADEMSVREGLSQVLSPEYKALAASCPNPYDRPGSAALIAGVLMGRPLGEILKKTFYNLPG